MKKFMNEFKEFISRGNVMDMAVGIIIGGAFTSIVSSLVDDIINPILGLFGGMNFDQLKLNLLGEVTLNYGKFISTVINFLIMALIVFFYDEGNEWICREIKTHGRSSRRKDYKRMPVLQERDCNCGNQMSTLYVEAGRV